MIDAGAVPVLIGLISSQLPKVRDQAVWAVGNIAGDGVMMVVRGIHLMIAGPANRDLILSLGGTDIFLALINSTDDIVCRVIRYPSF